MTSVVPGKEDSMARQNSPLPYLTAVLVLPFMLFGTLSCAGQPIANNDQSASEASSQEAAENPQPFIGELRYTSTSPQGTEEDLGTMNVSDDEVSWTYSDGFAIHYTVKNRKFEGDSWVYSLQSNDSVDETAQLSIPANLGEKNMRGTLGTCFLSKAENPDASSDFGTLTQSLFNFDTGEFSKSASFLKVMGNASGSSVGAFLDMSADALSAKDLSGFVDDVGCVVDESTGKGIWSINGTTLELKFTPEAGGQEGSAYTTTIEIIR